MAREVPRDARGRVRDGLTNGRVWVLGLVYFVLLAAGFGLTFFVPDLVQDRTGFSDFEVGVLSAIPYGFATVAMILAARRGTGLTVPILVGAAGTRAHRLRAVAAAPHGGHHARGGRAPVGASALLGVPDGDPERERGGGGHRARRRRRQPRRVRGPGVHRDRGGLDGRLRDAARGARRAAGRRRLLTLLLREERPVAEGAAP